MKKLLLLVSLCMSIPVFASDITNSSSYYYHICVTYDGGYTWKDEGTVNPNTSSSFDGTADAVAIGRIGDCNYNGTSWTNHAADWAVLDWSNQSNPNDGIHQEFLSNAAMIFWQESQPWVHSNSNVGLDSVCLYAGQVRPAQTAGCWL